MGMGMVLGIVLGIVLGMVLGMAFDIALSSVPMVSRLERFVWGFALYDVNNKLGSIIFNFFVGKIDT